MKLLFDQNLSFQLPAKLVDVFPGSDHVRPLGLMEADDTAIWQFARTGNFTIVTQDSDFADMAMLFGPPPKIIWLRCGNQPSCFIEKILRDHAAYITGFEQDVETACWEIY